MEIIRQRGYARAGLVGNPSDGFHGKTISLIVKDFFAEVILYEWEEIELVLSQEDHSRFRSIDALAHDVELHGYYGGIRLVKATIKRFVEYCRQQGIELHDRNFSIRYESCIPRQVGLAGSSAIIVATLGALLQFYNVEMPQVVQPSFVLMVENQELGIAAGLQDRVIQIYQGLVYMDFSKGAMLQQQGFECGEYETLDPALLPPIYIAYSTEAGNPTEVQHVPLRTRYQQQDSEILKAMEKFADIAAQSREAILTGDAAKLSNLIDENFDTRRSIVPLPDYQVQMVETARSVGASAKFAGSGGAIVGVYEDDTMLNRLREQLGAIGCDVFVPQIT